MDSFLYFPYFISNNYEAWNEDSNSKKFYFIFVDKVRVANYFENLPNKLVKMEKQFYLNQIQY